MTMRTSPLLSLTQKKTPKRGCEEMIYIFSQPLFYCPATGENPQVHRPYGVPATTLTALGCVGLQPLKNLPSLREYWKASPQSRLRRQPAIPTYACDLSRSPLMQIMGLPFLISTSASTSKTSAMASWVMTSIGGPWRWMMPFSRTRRSVE